ncbi:hypothetical protein P7H75_02660 [Vagococcus carniphilus]|uniref:hypothetical protein n=1 Tax=Vagococcus carniphilus TaxID=218144 RepID=UPI002891B348|nr:hypothetical protein [Vagococcus carniphilus]MDT2813734.1 hypothetical protein [Vagococcus carniphilus]
MKIDLDVIEKLLFESDYSAWNIGKETGLTRQTVLRYRNKQADYLNMKLANAIKLIDYYNKKEDEIKMKELIIEQLNNTFEDLKENGICEEKEDFKELSDWYYEPETESVYYVESGMEYSGDDKTAYYLGQTEGFKFINF